MPPGGICGALTHGGTMDEFALIRQFFRQGRQGHQGASGGQGVVLGPGDDGAILTPTPGCELVMSLDTLISGRHFPEDMPAEDIGWRSLAVNLSDLAAMGATPRWCLLSLSLPAADAEWLAAFCEGFQALARQADIALVGGDTVRGPLTITVQVTGEVPAGRALRRSGARPGDRLCIAGVPGEAAAGLAAWQAGARTGALTSRFCRPAPQLALGQKLRGIASACIDISDGLAADLGHILEESGVGAELSLAQLPCSPALAEWAASHPEDALARVQLAGGDDYLLLFTLMPGLNLPRDAVQIGRIRSEPGLQVLGADGELLPALPLGWDHFRT